MHDRPKDDEILHNCREEADLARDCYHETLFTFGESCYNQETLVEKAIVVAGYLDNSRVNPCVGKYEI